jgi:predicted MPP superfamily phosphohydrolase
MSIPYAGRPLYSRIFWFTLGAFANAAARVWPNPTQYMPIVERVQVPIAGLPAALDGLTIAHLSDFHCGPHVYASSVRRAAQIAQALKPELIVLTGDFVQRKVRYAGECAEALSLLRAPLGVHTVLGNHDYWDDERVVAAALRRKGLAPLRNEARRVVREGSVLYIVGVDDVRFHRADLTRALRGVPRGAPKIVLVHEPDFANHVQADNILLQLSGHSHGGQIRLPRIGAPLLPSWGRKYPMGLRRTPRGVWVYTTRGIGVAMPPVRLNCPPEVTLLTLARTSAPAASPAGDEAVVSRGEH